MLRGSRHSLPVVCPSHKSLRSVRASAGFVGSAPLPDSSAPRPHRIIGLRASTRFFSFNLRHFRRLRFSLTEATMPNTSKELLYQVDRPSILDGLLLSCKDPTSLTPDKHQSFVNPKGRPSFTPLPKSQALGRARDFLELMAKANKDLEMKAQENPPSNYDIEVLKDDENEYIEMNLLLGVADLHSDAAVAAAEASISGFKPTVADGDSDDDDDGDCDDDFDKIKGTEDNKRPVRPGTDYTKSSSEAKPNKRSKVVMLA